MRRAVVMVAGLLWASSAFVQGATAVFVQRDGTTQGSWTPTYGSEGARIATSPDVPPPPSSFVAIAGQEYLWADGTSDVRALIRADGTRAAATWFGSSVSATVTLPDANVHRLAVYLLDWDRRGRSEQLTVSDSDSGAVLDQQIVTDLSGGVYLQWQVSGDVTITANVLAGDNAVVSGYFLDPVAQAPPPVPYSFVIVPVRCAVDPTLSLADQLTRCGFDATLYQQLKTQMGDR